jgi:hypothetical protein
MFKTFLQRSYQNNVVNSALSTNISALQVNDDGILFSSFCTADFTKLQGKSRFLVAYLLQLQQEGYLRQTARLFQFLKLQNYQIPLYIGHRHTCLKRQSMKQKQISLWMPR